MNLGFLQRVLKAGACLFRCHPAVVGSQTGMMCLDEARAFNSRPVMIQKFYGLGWADNGVCAYGDRLPPGVSFHKYLPLPFAPMIEAADKTVRREGSSGIRYAV
jgi:hypothetical protein